MADIVMFTDGAARGNPGPGGYGTVLMSGKHRKELSQGFKNTTNNRMELLAVIIGLEALKSEGNRVLIYSDSRYVVDSVEKKWLDGWVKINFKGKKNRDLWERYIIAAKPHQVRIEWVKGHSTNKENNRCDFLATEASKQPYRLDDTGYNPE